MIGDSLRANPSNLISTLGEAKAKLMTGKYAFTFVIFRTILFRLLSIYLQLSDFCFLVGFFNLRSHRRYVPRERKNMSAHTCK